MTREQQRLHLRENPGWDERKEELENDYLGKLGGQERDRMVDAGGERI
jgi:hypothetical protein